MKIFIKQFLFRVCKQPFFEKFGGLHFLNSLLREKESFENQLPLLLFFFNYFLYRKRLFHCSSGNERQVVFPFTLALGFSCWILGLFMDWTFIFWALKAFFSLVQVWLYYRFEPSLTKIST